MVATPLRALAGAVPHGLPLTGHVVRAGLGRAFGPAPFDPARAPGDPGLFGPGSASWSIVADPAAIVGGIRSLLVQLLHPLPTAGVAEHSRFRDDPLERLQRTSAYITATTFGATAEALAAAATVRGAHRRIRGTAPNGRAYDAAHPHLLAWVSIALTSSFVATDRAYALQPADAATADRFVAEQSRAAALLDPRVDIAAITHDAHAQAALRDATLPLPMVDDGTLPADVAGLRARLESYDQELAVEEQGRGTLRFLLWPDIPQTLKAGYLPLLWGAVASLSRRQRRLLGLPPGVPVRALRVQTRLLTAGLRLAAGPSPSLAAAQRRAAAPPAPTAPPASPPRPARA